MQKHCTILSAQPGNISEYKILDPFGSAQDGYAKMMIE
jgi:hypothetical protein